MASLYPISGRPNGPVPIGRTAPNCEFRIRSNAPCKPGRSGSGCPMGLGLRYKIIVPFGVLLLFVGTTGTALASAQLSNEATAEFDAGLLRSSVLANAQLSQLEADRLTLLRAATNTVGVAEAVESQDRTALSRLLIPLAANAPVELEIRIVDAAGQELIAIDGTPAQAEPPSARALTWSGIAAGDLTQRADVDSTDEIGYLASAFNEMTRSLQDKTQELEETYFASMEALARAIDARDPSTYGHSARVAAVSLLIANAMGLPQESREALRRGALLHDIGKIGVADRILRKPGRLTRVETTDMREHPRIGYQMLKGLRFMQPSLDGVLHHHERWEGGGYPDRLAGTEIPLYVRILAVADVFDAITADRPYRAGLAFGEAIKAIEKGAGTQFDPDVVKAFLSCRRAIIDVVQPMGKVSRPDAEEATTQETRLKAA